MAEGGSKQNVDPALVGTTKAKIACGLLCFAAFSHGVLLSWANPTIPQMELGKSHFLGGNYDDPLLKGSTNESLLASAHSIGAMIGALLSGPLLILANKIGHQLVLPGLGLLSLLAWGLVGLVPFIPATVAGRGLGGLFVISLSSLVPGYMTTVLGRDNAKLNSWFLSGYNIARALGGFATVIGGKFLDWPIMSLLFGGGPSLAVVISFVTLIPVYPPKRGSGGGGGPVKTNCEIAQSMGRLIFMVTCFALSGVGTTTTFTSKLVPNDPKQDDEKNYTAYDFTVAATAMMVSSLVGTILSPVITNFTGKRINLIITNAIMAASMGGLATFYSFFPTGGIAPRGAAEWVPIIVFVLFSFALGVGIGSHFGVFLGDLPSQGMQYTLPAIMFWMNALNFAGNFVFPLIASIPGAFPVLFGFHSAVSVVALVFSIFSRLEVDPDNIAEDFAPLVTTETDQDGTVREKTIGGGFLKSIATRETREGTVREKSVMFGAKMATRKENWSQAMMTLNPAAEMQYRAMTMNMI